MSNHFCVGCDLTKTIYSYWVKIDQANDDGRLIETMSTTAMKYTSNKGHKLRMEQVFRNVMKRVIENNSAEGDMFYKIACIYDGNSCLYTSEQLPMNAERKYKSRNHLSESTTYRSSDDNQDFEVEIKLVDKLRLQSIKNYYENPVNNAPSETIRSINLVVRELLLSMRFLVGRSSFHNRAETRPSISALVARRSALVFVNRPSAFFARRSSLVFVNRPSAFVVRRSALVFVNRQIISKKHMDMVNTLKIKKRSPIFKSKKLSM